MDAKSSLPVSDDVKRRPRPKNLPRGAFRGYVLADLLGYPRLPLMRRP